MKPTTLATEELAAGLVRSIGWLSEEEKEAAADRLARRFQVAWLEEWHRLNALHDEDQLK